MSDSYDDKPVKRPPVIYVCGSCRDSFIRFIKMDMISAVSYNWKVKFLDPIRHPNSRDDVSGIVDVNTRDIEASDVVITVTGEKIGAGTSIEMYIAGAVMKKPVFLFTNVKRTDITPHVLNICKSNVYELNSVSYVVNSWVAGWYGPD
jgi:hypothetical protein